MSDMYYNLNKLLSRDKLLNFVVGNRGGGKSYAAKRWAINSWIKNKKQFIYLRRYFTEFENINSFFSDIESNYTGHNFEVKNGCFYIDNEIAGYYMALSTSQRNKSNTYPDVDKIIFDEFIIDKGAYHYIKDEVTLFLDLCETVFRMRDFKALLISNAITSVNPYFMYFGLYPKDGAKFVTKNECCVEFYKSEEFVRKKKETKFGKLIDGTRYGAYNIDNEFYRDNYTFIEKMHGRCVPWVHIKYMNDDYYIWYGTDSGYVYFNHTPTPNNTFTMAMTTDDHTPNYMLIKNFKNSKYLKDVRMCFEIGTVRFDCLKSKNAFYEIMQLM